MPETPASPPALSAPARARRMQQLDDLTATALRALSGNASLSYRDLSPWRGNHPMPWQAPHLACTEADGLLARRALADGVALRELGTDPVTHGLYAPKAPLARLLYEWFETFRTEALVPAHWPGVRRNMNAHFHDWSQRFHDAPLIETHLGLLLFTVSQIVRSRLHHQPPEERFQDTMEATRAGLSAVLGPSLREMSRHIDAPNHFSPASSQLAVRVADLVAEAHAQSKHFAPKRHSASSAFFLSFDPEPQDNALPIALLGPRAREAQSATRYRAYTHAFDREVSAATLIRSAVLDAHSAQVAAAVLRLRLPIRRLARELAQVVQEPQSDGWLFEQEDGRIDGRQLTRLITSPGERRLFKQAMWAPCADAALTLLIDCSGSMKQHALPVAMFANVFNRLCGLAQLPFEVLGFSTSSWNGGQARRQWQRQGQSENPGRVADLLHLVYQSHGMRPMQARRDIATLLKADLYREGLDGEAVEWACARLARTAAKRRLLLVVSDGCPNETATSQLTGEQYLPQHLCDVVAQQMRQGVEIIGVGLALDLRNFYPRNLPIEPEALLNTSTFSALLRLMQAGKSRRRISIN